MSSPQDRRYAKTHEWHKAEDGLVTVGLSQFAVEELTDITFVDIEKTEGQIAAGESFGEIESVKATSEIYSAIDGQIAQINTAVIEDPSILNKDPWNAGWLIKIEPADPKQLDTLIPANDYDQQHAI